MTKRSCRIANVTFSALLMEALCDLALGSVPASRRAPLGLRLIQITQLSKVDKFNFPPYRFIVSGADEVGLVTIRPQGLVD